MNPESENLVVSLEQFEKHLGRHLENLSLFTLPRRSDDDADSGSLVPSDEAAVDNEVEDKFSLGHEDIRGDQSKHDEEWNPTEFDEAVKHGDLLVVKSLLEIPEYRPTRNDLNHALLGAASAGQLEIAMLLLDIGADVNTSSPTGRTPLHEAVETNRFPVVKFLLESGADVMLRSQDGQTVLHIAAMNGDWPVVKFLVENGADLNAECNDGMTALAFAAWQSQLEMVKWLIERGADSTSQYPKILVRLAYIYALPDEAERPNPVRDLDLANSCIDHALRLDPKDSQAWYILGRCFMQRGNYSKAYEAYQQAVYRNSRNSKMWSSIGILYQEINQFRDALDGYTRAIRLNPYIPEIWFNLGSLYERANNQVQDAIGAYHRPEELDDTYTLAAERVKYLKSVLETGQSGVNLPAAPQEIDPLRYADNVNTIMEGPDALNPSGSEDAVEDLGLAVEGLQVEEVPNEVEEEDEDGHKRGIQLSRFGDF